jgi:hypothetical protein
MKQRFVIGFVAAALTALTFTAAHADTYVRGHTRSNGTYVAPHYRSDADSSFNNNWSTAPNINPYTGQAGTRAPSYDFSPTIPYSPSGPSFYSPMDNAIADYIFNGR